MVSDNGLTRRTDEILDSRTKIQAEAFCLASCEQCSYENDRIINISKKKERERERVREKG